MYDILGHREVNMVEIIELQERRRGTRCCDISTESRMSTEQARRLSEDMQILGHPIRLQLLDLLASNEGQVCVCDLEGAVPVKQPTVSHHLKLLREAGLIDYEKHGLWAFYFVNREALADLRQRVERQLIALAP